MKKPLFLAVALAGFATTAASAQDAPSTQLPQTELQYSGKQRIPAAQLPEGVKQALQHDVLQEWQVREVYRVHPGKPTEAQAEAVYEVYFTNAAQQHTVDRFNAAGERWQYSTDQP